MTYIASSSKRRYEELIKSPLLFCVFEKRSGFNEGMGYTHTGWFSCDATIDFYISEEQLAEDENHRMLFIIGKQTEHEDIYKEKEELDIVSYEISKFNADRSKDWEIIFRDCVYNYGAGNTRHSHMSLIWALYKHTWKESIVCSALANIEKCDIEIIKKFVKVSLPTFSLDKQYQLVNVFKSYIADITALCHPDLDEAVRLLSPDIKINTFSLYDKIDYILVFGRVENERTHLQKIYQTSLNRYIHFKYWFEHPGHELFDYNFIVQVYSCVSPNVQLSIVKRYLHDVRLKVRTLDSNLLNDFRDVKYKAFADIRYFIEKAGSNIDLVAPMFCDAILTILANKGSKIQDFNGILDFAVTHSNIDYPCIDLGVRKILPFCDGGLRHNPSFIGFIRYSITYEFDETLLTDKNLRSAAEYILRHNAIRQYRDRCAATEKELDPDTLKKCKSEFCDMWQSKKSNNQNKANEKPDCFFISHERYIPDRWIKKGGEYDGNLALCVENISEVKEPFTFDNVSLPWLKHNLSIWGNKYPQFEYYDNIIPADVRNQEFVKFLRGLFYKPVKIKLIPNTGVFFASKVSLFGLWNSNGINSTDNDFAKKIEERAQIAESPTVYKKTFDALEKMFPDCIKYQAWIEIPYNQDDLNKAKDFFYYNYYELRPGQENDERESKKFLAPKRRYNTFYCTPKLSNSCEKVSGLGFFWCGSDECFCNVLDTQTLDKENDWHNYTLYHASEIIGYSLFQKTGKIKVPKEIVANFASDVRQAERMYGRLKCRSCGHMIFSTRGSILNGSRFFSCQNKYCKQYNKEVYLSQCNTCKKGLIDSRDSKRCENGWVICPNCLSCCNDQLFDDLVAKARRNGYVSQRLLDNIGKGHNNKKKFFCPVCAMPIQKITIKDIEKQIDGTEKEVEKTVLGCQECKKEYEIELERNKYTHEK